MYTKRPCCLSLVFALAAALAFSPGCNGDPEPENETPNSSTENGTPTNNNTTNTPMGEEVEETWSTSYMGAFSGDVSGSFVDAQRTGMRLTVFMSETSETFVDKNGTVEISLTLMNFPEGSTGSVESPAIAVSLLEEGYNTCPAWEGAAVEITRNDGVALEGTFSATKVVCSDANGNYEFSIEGSFVGEAANKVF